MLIPKQCNDVSPQCPQAQEDGYRLGWYHGQVNMADRHDGTPCQIVRLEAEIEVINNALIKIATGDIKLDEVREFAYGITS